MTLDEMYPYWGGAHDELLETVAPLGTTELDDRPPSGAPTIREIVLEFVHDERFWISHLVAGNDYERPRADRFPDAAALVEVLAAAREVTARVLAPLGRDGLRAVRLVPADPRANRPEMNMPISWLFWRVMEREIFVWGQIRRRLEDRRERRL